MSMLHDVRTILLLTPMVSLVVIGTGLTLGEVVSTPLVAGPISLRDRLSTAVLGLAAGAASLMALQRVLGLSIGW